MINPLAGFEAFANRSVRGYDAATQTGQVLTGLDAATAGGLAFLVSQLEKQDPRLLEPTTSVYWFRDIVQNVGGGYVDFSSHYFPNYSVSGSQTGIVSSQTSKIPVIQADIAKVQYRVFEWANNLRLPFIDMQKLKNTPFSLQQLLDKGLRLSYNKDMDQIVFNGVGSIPGLINNATISQSTVATSWTAAIAANTTDVIHQQIDTLINETWTASNFDVDAMANTILLPPAKFKLLNNAFVIGGAGVAVSLREYILQNNAASAQGVPLSIRPNPFCTGAGVGATDRMVAYRLDGEKMSFGQDVTVPLTRGLTQVSLTEGQAYLTNYHAMIGQVQPLYPQGAAYADGI